MSYVAAALLLSFPSDAFKCPKDAQSRSINDLPAPPSYLYLSLPLSLFACEILTLFLPNFRLQISFHSSMDGRFLKKIPDLGNGLIID